MTTGRNAPCHCGSGRKYKKCCMEKDEQSNPLLRARRLMEARDSAMAKALSSFAREYPEKWMEIAMVDFLTDDVSDADEMGDLPPQFFLSFFLLHWTSRRHEDAPIQPPVSVPPAVLLLQNHEDRLTATEQRYIEEAAISPYSFHEVTDIVPDQGCRLIDILTGMEAFVADVSGSRSVERGDILYAMVVEVDGTAILGGASPLRIPFRYKLMLIDMRAEIRKSLDRPPAPMDLLGIDSGIRSLYWRIHESLVHPQAPVLHNTDGHLLEFHTLKYDIQGVEEAFRKLASLCVTHRPEEISEDAVRDRSGRITAIDFDWNRKGNRQIASFENTVLGHLRLKGKTMTVEVNSRKRADTIRKRIEKLASDVARLRSIEVTPLEQKLAEQRSADRRRRESGNDLMRHPEGRDVLRQFQRRHMETWLDEKVRALGNRSPREAVQDPDGREKVEVLLQDFEQMEARREEGPIDLDLYREIREQLGLV